MNHSSSGRASTTQLETRLVQALRQNAERVHATPELRAQVLQRISSTRSSYSPPWLVVAVSLLLICLLGVLLTSYLVQQKPRPIVQSPSITYTQERVVTAPDQLALQGRPISLDPTGKHLVYQPANQPGILYTTDITDPLGSNLLAMRDAHDIAWAPDGSALVTTVLPAGAQKPFLALVHTGKYMQSLQQSAEAASWLPTSTSQITYVTHANGHTHLWGTTPSGQTPTLLVTMNQELLTRHLAWSHNGQLLALVATSSTTSGNKQGIYIVDAKTQALRELVPPGDYTITDLSWSPDQTVLAYSQIDTHNQETLHIIELKTGAQQYSISLQQHLLGWSWSPDSHALIYSDGGKLAIHTFSGPAISLPASTESRTYPFWLTDGRILYLHTTNGVGKLVFLKQTP